MRDRYKTKMDTSGFFLVNTTVLHKGPTRLNPTYTSTVAHSAKILQSHETVSRLTPQKKNNCTHNTRSNTMYKIKKKINKNAPPGTNTYSKNFQNFYGSTRTLCDIKIGQIRKRENVFVNSLATPFNGS